MDSWAQVKGSGWVGGVSYSQEGEGQFGRGQGQVRDS